MGRLQHGEYVADYEDVHPEVLERYYGEDWAEHSEDEGEQRRPSSDDGLTLEDHVAEDQAANVRHAPVETPTKGNPFEAYPGAEILFMDMLRGADERKFVPEQFNLRAEEWGESGYEESEPIKMRGGKIVDIPVPFLDWWPRAVRWSRALYLMTRLIEDLDS